MFPKEDYLGKIIYIKVVVFIKENLSKQRTSKSNFKMGRYDFSKVSA